MTARASAALLLASAIAAGTLMARSAAPAPIPAPGPTAAEIDAAAGAPRVRFTEPPAHGLILGQTRLTVEATPAEGARIARVEIHVDGALLSILEKAPYTLVWDAGRRPAPRALRAVAFDTAGRSGETTLVVRPLAVGQYEEVRLVALTATVRDRKGEAILDLARDDFTVLEDGVPQALTHFSPARAPLACALLIDASNSMTLGGRIELARKGAEEFVDTVADDDRLFVLHFNDGIHGALDRPVSDKRAAREAIAAIQARGGTALYDAVHRTATRLADAEGRRVIVLLSDGRDQALEENEPGSLHLFEEALERAHRSDVTIYAIGLGHHLENELDLAQARSLKEILDTLARDTGGRSYYPDRPGRLGGVYRQIAADLKQQYALAYAPTNRTRDGAWRTITVRVWRPDATVQARRGYYAPADSTR